MSPNEALVIAWRFLRVYRAGNTRIIGEYFPDVTRNIPIKFLRYRKNVTHMSAISQELTILGLESSCDETAIAVVRRHKDGRGEILSNVVLSQIEDHAPYGGVVPEIAARAHVDHIDRLIMEALENAQISFAALDGVAATSGPGLVGGVMVGLMSAKAIALAHDLPLIGVNHLEGHALTVRLTDALPFPYLLLLASGGHTQLLTVSGVGKYRRIGATMDDALGEAYDKTAKLLSLGFPGGPAVESAARQGNPERFALPRPLAGTGEPNFSFSGLKTAVRHAAQNAAPLSPQDISDLCASFQRAVTDVLNEKCALAMKRHARNLNPGTPRRFVMAGGVAANSAIRESLERLCQDEGFELSIPPAHLCTDNGAMIAWAGAEKLALGLCDDLDIPARARWPLDERAAPLKGAGVKA